MDVYLGKDVGGDVENIARMGSDSDGSVAKGTERVKLFWFVVVWAKIASFGDLRAATAVASQFGVLEIGLLCLQDPVDNFGKGVPPKAARSSGAWSGGVAVLQGSGGGSFLFRTAIPARADRAAFLVKFFESHFPRLRDSLTFTINSTNPAVTPILH